MSSHTCGHLESHPLLQRTADPNLVWIADFNRVSAVAPVLYSLLENQAEEPYDALLGDDVSGRIPTLISHYFLNLAFATGKIDSVPKTFFATSGFVRKVEANLSRVPDFATETAWRRLLAQYAQHLTTEHEISRMAIITEVVNSGVSLSRLTQAFSPFVECIDPYVANNGGFYTKGMHSGNTLRHMIGVEKHPPSPVSERIINFDGRKTADFRSFLKAYSELVYFMLFNEYPPGKIVRLESGGSMILSNERPKGSQPSLPGLKYIREPNKLADNTLI